MEEINRLIEESLDVLRTYAENITRNSYNADDLLNETILRVIEKKELFKPETNFIGWCVTIMRNINLNKLDYEKVRSTEDLEDYKDYGDLVEFNECEENVCKKFIKDNLSEKLSECFLLYYSGYDYKSISETLNIPIGTVKSRINSSKKILKTLIRK